MRRYLAVFLIAGCAWGQNGKPSDYPTVTNVKVVDWSASGAVTVHAKDATTVKLADDEYAHLQSLRQAVAAEENRLAVKYGAIRKGSPNGYMCAGLGGYEECLVTDHYEFHGQFLLIERSK